MRVDKSVKCSSKHNKKHGSTPYVCVKISFEKESETEIYITHGYKEGTPKVEREGNSPENAVRDVENQIDERQAKKVKKVNLNFNIWVTRKYINKKGYKYGKVISKEGVPYLFLSKKKSPGFREIHGKSKINKKGEKLYCMSVTPEQLRENNLSLHGRYCLTTKGCVSSDPSEQQFKLMHHSWVKNKHDRKRLSVPCITVVAWDF